ncbi:acylneuraminate cytidylyltransferase family protein [Urechidicola vernalis]|uniref:Acylneuraminate cytidylyltransferase family protein n=1 Tax=Urechidicola vernalis TaxID=3075600 RepID=A0ABU2Y7H5_9FLAO|nr:acylneuraminate cytidylyltransferase family protein [Urechidicola sp. P050]MDT0554152.1 acylneuraminate cytidylyltransferase family protein [Urechidicola sp. P050]
MNLLITICARGGSKGIPQKNIKLLNGIPLIFYSLNTAIKFSTLSDFNVDIVLSTDSKQILNLVKQKYNQIDIDYIRPEYLATDTVGKIDVIKDVYSYSEEKNNLRYDYILDLDVTSPLRTILDLENALRIIETKKEAYNIFSVSPSSRNPYFNMVEENREGYFEVCKKGDFFTRQSTPKVFDMNASFYIYRRNFFEEKITKSTTVRSLIYEVPHLCFDLDEEIDFEFMSYLLENDKLEFEL